MISKTDFLPETAGIGERIYCIDKEIKIQQLCYCGNPVKYIKYSQGYSKRCSRNCTYSDPIVSEKRKLTCLKKYGHKISIQYGFLNEIYPLIIGSLENLCITKRSINISKNKLTEQQFKEKLNGLD